MDCGETREPIEFIFGRYLPLVNSNPHPKGRPPPPPRGGVMGPQKFGFYGKVQANFEQLRSNLARAYPLTNETCLPNFSPIGLPVGSYGAPKCPLGPNFGNVCGLRPNGLADLVHFWQVPTPRQQQPPTQRGPSSSPRGEVMGPQNFGFYGKA